MSELKEVYDAKTTSALDEYKAEHARSISDIGAYWGTIAKTSLDWFQPFTKAYHGSLRTGSHSFFLNGKLNTCYNCLDRHIIAGNENDVAITWEGDEPGNVQHITFGECLEKVCQIANVLLAKGVKKGDVVTIYLPMIPEAVMTMLACARIGAIHSVIFAGFSPDAISDRVAAAKSKYLVTSDGGLRGGKKLKLKDICDEALTSKVCEGIVETMFVFHHYNVDESTVKMVEGRDVKMEELLEAQRPYCPAVWMDSEDPLFILYTSGSTGQPKGVLHTVGGYTLYAMITTKTSFDLQKGRDVFACVADVGWITGHSYICYGPMLNGMSTFMFEGTPLYPDAGRYWDMVQRHKITAFYTAPTAIRSLMRFGNEIVTKYDKSSLRVLGTVGEPINPQAWQWYYEVVGSSKCSIVDTYWQTETGGHIVTNLPGITPMKPGSCTMPFYGIDTVVLDAQSGKEIEGNDVNGVLAIKQAWPGLARTCLGDHGRFLTTYMKPYPGYYLTGDGCHRDKDGYIWITGRIDDVINVSGHRIGTAEIESALATCESVSQAAVVGFPHDIKGQGICAYVQLMQGFEESDELLKELKGAVKKIVGPFAAPDIICCTPAMPMTRSGKIMRRILRKISSNESDSIGDTSTLADPSVVDALIEKMHYIMNPHLAPKKTDNGGAPAKKPGLPFTG